MGIAFVIKGAKFKQAVGTASLIPSRYPSTDTLKALYYLGGTIENSLLDHTRKGKNAILTGSINVSENYVTISGNMRENSLTTPIYTMSGHETTIVALFRVPSDVRCIASTYDSYNFKGFTLTNDRVFIIKGDGSMKNCHISAPLNSNGFFICALSISENGFRYVKDDNGSIVELVNEDVDIRISDVPIIIGGATGDTSFNATADISFVSIHTGRVDDTLLKQIFAYVRKYAEDNGIDVN